MPFVHKCLWCTSLSFYVVWITKLTRFGTNKPTRISCLLVILLFFVLFGWNFCYLFFVELQFNYSYDCASLPYLCDCDNAGHIILHRTLLNCHVLYQLLTVRDDRCISEMASLSLFTDLLALVLNSKQHLACKFGIMETVFHRFCLRVYAYLKISWYTVIWEYTTSCLPYFLASNILISTPVLVFP